MEQEGDGKMGRVLGSSDKEKEKAGDVEMSRKIKVEKHTLFATDKIDSECEYKEE